jgi:hypothetical protein
VCRRPRARGRGRRGPASWRCRPSAVSPNAEFPGALLVSAGVPCTWSERDGVAADAVRRRRAIGGLRRRRTEALTAVDMVRAGGRGGRTNSGRITDSRRTGRRTRERRRPVRVITPGVRRRRPSGRAPAVRRLRGDRAGRAGAATSAAGDLRGRDEAAAVERAGRSTDLADTGDVRLEVDTIDVVDDAGVGADRPDVGTVGGVLEGRREPPRVADQQAPGDRDSGQVLDAGGDLAAAGLGGPQGDVRAGDGASVDVLGLELAVVGPHAEMPLLWGWKASRGSAGVTPSG